MLFNFRNITYTLGNSERRINLSGSVESGNVLVLQGVSGSGKSTLLRILARLKPAGEGECFLGGVHWSSFSACVWRQNVHYLFQNAVLFEGNVWDNLTKPFQLKVFQKMPQVGLTRAKELISQLLLPQDILEQDAKTLSGGEAARIVFIRALLINPRILLLDEPTAALDDKARIAFYEVLSAWLKQPEHGAILISHNNDFRDLSNYDILDFTE